MSKQKKSIKLPKDIEHGSAFYTSKGYVRWSVMIGGKQKVGEVNSETKAFAKLRAAIAELTGETQAPIEGQANWKSRSLAEWISHVLDNESPFIEETTRDLYRCVLNKWVLGANEKTSKALEEKLEITFPPNKMLRGVNKEFVTGVKSILTKALCAEKPLLGFTGYRNVCTAFSLCLRKAANFGYIDPGLDAFLRLDRNEKKKVIAKAPKRRRYLKAEDRVKLLKSFETESNPFHPGLLLGSMTGMRPAEIAGLKWEHVHLDARTPHIAVERQLKRVKGKGLVEKDLKTENSRRLVPLVPVLVEVLRGIERKSIYVFLGDRDQPYDTSGIAKIMKRRVTALKITCADGSVPVFST